MTMSERAIRCEVARLSFGGEKHEGFSFGQNGYFFDDNGFPIVLWGVVEMESFLRHLDARFAAPIGRKILYSATDAEELLLRHSSFAKPRFGGRKKLHRLLASRSSRMGWGLFGPGTVQSPCHDTLSVGFALAHEEHFAGARLDINWRQSQAELIHFEVAQKSSTIQPAQAPILPEWGRCKPVRSPEKNLDLDLEVREHGFFFGEQRSFFLPSPVFDFLLHALQGRPLATSLEKNWLQFSPPDADNLLFSAFASAAKSMFEESIFPVYVLEEKDWTSHVVQRVQHRGMGRVSVLETRLDGDFETVFRVQSPHPSVVCGILVGMWERCNGRRSEVRIQVAPGFVDLSLRSPSVEYHEII